MTTYSGSLNYQANRLDLADPNGQIDESQYNVIIDAMIGLNLTITSGLVTGTGTISESVNAIAVFDSDHDTDQVSDVNNATIPVNGSLSWSGSA